MQYISHCQICDFKEFATIDGYDYKPRPEVYKFLGMLSNKSLWNICINCGFLFQNPRPSSEAIGQLYSTGLYRSGRKYTDEFFHSRYTRPLLHLEWAKKKAILPNDSVLDIGAGYGGAVKAFQDHGFLATGIELDQNLCVAATDRYGVHLINSDIEECEFPSDFFGLIYSAHVHEHFDDFMVINRKLCSWLTNGGYLLCILPTYRFAAKNGQGFISVFHNSIFTRTSLHNMFVKSGLDPVAFCYPHQHSLAEIWGLARKPADMQATHNLICDNWKIILWEIQNSPEIFEAVYKSIVPAYHKLRKSAKWIFRT